MLLNDMFALFDDELTKIPFAEFERMVLLLINGADEFDVKTPSPPVPLIMLFKTTKPVALSASTASSVLLEILLPATVML